MSVKFTKNQIKNIILEEHRKLLLEINLSSIKTVVRALSGSDTLATKLTQVSTLSKMLGKAEIDKMVKIIKGSDNTALASKAFVRELDNLIKSIDDLLKSKNLDDASKKILEAAKKNAAAARKAAEDAGQTALAIPKKGTTSLAVQTGKGGAKQAAKMPKKQRLLAVAALLGTAGLVTYLISLLSSTDEALAGPKRCLEQLAKAAGFVDSSGNPDPKAMAQALKKPDVYAAIMNAGALKAYVQNGVLDQQCVAILQAYLPAPPAPGPTPGPGGPNYKAQQQSQFGRCRTYAIMVTKGPKNMAKAFVKDMKHLQRTLVELGYNLGTFGPNGDGVDGDYGRAGSLTRKAIIALQKSVGLKGRKADGVWGKGTSTAIEASVKATQSNKIYDAIKKTLVGPPSKCAGTQTGGQDAETGNVDTQQAIRAYMTAYNIIRGKILRNLEAKNVQARKGRIATTLISPFLPPLRARTGFYAFDGQSYSTSNPKLGQLLMTKLKDLKNNAAKAEQSLGLKGGEVTRIISRVGDEFLESVLQESKSYNLDFSKYSKLWD